MIVRFWRARATREGSAAYRQHFATHVRPELLGLDGFLGALVLEREDADAVEITVETRWASLAAIRAFAGDEPERAVVEPGARAVLESFEERVLHYVVALAVERP